MKQLKELAEMLENDAQIKRFKELEELIDQDVNLKAQYKELLDAQKIMVQREVKQHPRYLEAKEHYDALLDQLLEHVLMSEYLDLLEEINNDLNWIQEIIESEIAKDFD
jgi:cell fate (sporulation/competence/biofilm development) regulator YmcA (YheA/YmcA/DUF963 family)